MKMRGDYLEPKGLKYQDFFLTFREEAELLDFVEKLHFEEVILHGQAAKRTVAHFGFHYDYQAVSLSPGDPFPPELKNLITKCAHFAEIPEDEIVQCLISKYPKGSTIGWHTDKFIFGPKVIGISLGSECKMHFQWQTSEKRFVWEAPLLPRSIYILSDESRTHWQHSIPPTPDLRYSITFRTKKH